MVGLDTSTAPSGSVIISILAVRVSPCLAVPVTVTSVVASSSSSATSAESADFEVLVNVSPVS